MNKIFTFIYCFLLLSALCWAGGNKEQPQNKQQQAAPPPAQPLTPPPPPASKYWTGDGGKGKSITILPPRGSGLAKDQEYLPDFVANELVSNFRSYSAMTLFDRVGNQKQYNELLSGIYADDDKAGLDIGHLTSTDYMLVGDITKTSSGYVLHLTVNNNSDKTTTAAYSGTVSIAELDNLIGIRQASLDLLQKMGVTLTALAQGELAKAAEANRVNGQTALARSITAQRSGTVVEALFYSYQAESFDNTLLEAASRASNISTSITSGNIGENVRNEIQRRDEWKKILDEADIYFSNHPPFEIVYDPSLSQGSIDYNKRTVEITLSLAVNPNNEGFQVLSDIRKGLIETRRMREWGFEFWPLIGSTMFEKGSRWYRDNATSATASKSFRIGINLINSDNKIISRTSAYINMTMDFLIKYNQSTGRGEVDLTTISCIPKVERISFNSVNANDITNNLAVQITSINGISIDDIVARRYISISTRPYKLLGSRVTSTGLWYEYSKTSTGNTDFSVYVITGYTGNETDVRIPDSINDVVVRKIASLAFYYNKLTSIYIPYNVTEIGENAFSGNQLTSITLHNGNIGTRVFNINRMSFEDIPNSIGESVFYDNKLTSVTIPNGIRSIRRGAFSRNQLTSINIPDSVTSIGALAFSNNRLSSIIIPTSVRAIGSSAFFGNRDLNSITIGENVNIGATGDGLETSNDRYSSFTDFYNGNGKKAGRYTYSNGKWNYNRR